jgi:proteic killer suppression protein
MIVSFKHRGLKRFYETRDRSGINPNYAERIQLILYDLEAADCIEYMRRPGYRLHALKGPYAGYYAIDVSSNWRIIFQMNSGKVFDIDLLDYH